MTEQLLQSEASKQVLGALEELTLFSSLTPVHWEMNRKTALAN